MKASEAILLVDDDDDLRETLTMLLERRGYCVVGASNGREALDLLASELSPCIILLDLMMPVMDGYEFLAQQKQNARIAGIPVVVITAGTAIRPDELDAMEVLKKPVDLPRLLDTLHQWC